MKFDGISSDKKKMILICLAGLIAILLIISIIYVVNNGGVDVDDVGGGSTYADDLTFDQEAKEYWQKYPIISYLPIIESNYRIDYGECEMSEGEFCLMISANTQAAREKALEALYDVESSYSGKYRIEYFPLEQ